MALASHSPVAFTGTRASNLLRSSSNGVRGVPLRTLGRTRLGTSTRRDFTISAKVRKHDRPWPSDLNPDPNVKGGILSYLSHFKPLKEKPKRVTLEFEKPLVDLERKINDIRKMAADTGLDFSEQILSLENKYNLAVKDLYTHLTPMQRLHVARHPNRPTCLDHIFNITDKFVELHGDRAGYDDPAIVTGIGSIDGQTYMFIGHQKGRNTKENIHRNFGMPTPHGYRKALRMMLYADHHGFPIVSFVDTPGAMADLKSEELGIGEAIAQNLRSMFGLKVPFISIVIGEGGSGGALAIACANKMLMLENAVFYVASPEACAAILWKTAKAAPKAAENLKITATDLCKLQIADGVIPEPLGAAHADPAWTSQQIKNAINEGMAELMKMDTEELLKHRAAKYRKIGVFQEGIPVDPAKSFNMKKRDVPIDPKDLQLVLELEVEHLKQQIAKAVESSGEPPKLALNETLEKLKKEISLEFSEASKSLGFKEKLETLREDLLKMNTGDSLDPAFKSKLDNLRSLFDQNLPNAPNYESLQTKLGMLKELSKAMSLAERNHMASVMKQEVNRKMDEVKERPGFKEKLSELKSEIQRSGASRWEDLDGSVKQKLATLKAEIEPQFVEVLQSSGLEVNIDQFGEDPSLPSNVKENIKKLNEELQQSIGTIVDSTDVKYSIEQLKLEIALAGKTPDEAAKKRIAELEQRIKQTLASALESSELEQKHDKLMAEIFDSIFMSSFEGIEGRFISANGRTP